MDGKDVLYDIPVWDNEFVIGTSTRDLDENQIGHGQAMRFLFVAELSTSFRYRAHILLPLPSRAKTEFKVHPNKLDGFLRQLKGASICDVHRGG